MHQNFIIQKQLKILYRCFLISIKPLDIIKLRKKNSGLMAEISDQRMKFECANLNIDKIKALEFEKHSTIFVIFQKYERKNRTIIINARVCGKVMFSYYLCLCKCLCVCLSVQAVIF